MSRVQCDAMRCDAMRHDVARRCMDGRLSTDGDTELRVRKSKYYSKVDRREG